MAVPQTWFMARVGGGRLAIFKSLAHTMIMTTTEAKELLQIHSFSHPDLKHPKMATGFLGSLRPYRGHLVEENFHEIMAALRILAPSLQQPTVDREVVRALWSICYLGRSWGVCPGGMLQRNSLIQPEDVNRLDAWLDRISYATFFLLEGCDIEEAFHGYDKPTTT